MSSRTAGGGGEYVALNVFPERRGEWRHAGGAAQGGQRYERRHVLGCWLSKCVANGALDSELTKEDKERMMEFLKIYGPLNENSAYMWVGEGGIQATPPGAGQQVAVDDRADGYEDTAGRELLGTTCLSEESWDWAGDDDAAGGRDGPDSVCVCEGAGAGDRSTSSPVTEIPEDGETGAYGCLYTQNGATKQVEAMYCIIAIPFSILEEDSERSVSAGSSKWWMRARWVRRTKIACVGEQEILGAGLQHLWWVVVSGARGRESDVWYPSSRLMHPTGIVVSGYTDEVGTGLEQS